MKPLPKHLEYAFLEKDSLLPVVISALLKDDEKKRLISVLKKHKEVFAWKTSKILGISPSFCKHKINFEDDAKPVIQQQRRLNPNMKEIVKKEIIKLLIVNIIYPIEDSPWVSPVHCVPKKGGMAVVTNEKNELVPKRTVIDIFKSQSTLTIRKRPRSLVPIEPTPTSIKNKKGAENVTADHLSRLENPNLEELRGEDIDDNFPGETLMNFSSNDEDDISRRLLGVIMAELGGNHKDFVMIQERLRFAIHGLCIDDSLVINARRRADSFVDFRLWLDIRLLSYSTVHNPWSSLIPLSRGSFDMIMGMDWLSKRKFMIVCHEKVVRVPLEGDEILRVHGERTLGAAKALMNAKLDKTKLSDISVRLRRCKNCLNNIKGCKTKVSFDLVIFCKDHQCRLLRRGAWSSFEVSVGITEEGEVVTYPRFIANFSKVVKPLTSLTERNQKYEWGVEREEFPDFEE
ncbi:hypothetical protein Tco_0080612 [Tanacetum coccineum]